MNKKWKISKYQLSLLIRNSILELKKTLNDLNRNIQQKEIAQKSLYIKKRQKSQKICFINTFEIVFQISQNIQNIQKEKNVKCQNRANFFKKLNQISKQPNKQKTDSKKISNFEKLLSKIEQNKSEDNLQLPKNPIIHQEDNFDIPTSQEQLLIDKFTYQLSKVHNISDRITEIQEIMKTFSSYALEQEQQTIESKLKSIIKHKRYFNVYKQRQQRINVSKLIQ